MKKFEIFFKVVLSLFLLWTINEGSIYSQNVQVQGKVTDATTGEVLPGVAVVIKGTTKGTTTDVNGSYTISASQGAVLTFSFIGYTSQDVTITNQTINVALVAEVSNLEEVVVVGYGTVKKSDATGSVNVVSTKDFNKGAITNPQDLLVGKSAGVVITTAGGAPGTGATIRIRGGSSLNASNDPLVIIDGVPLDNNTIGGSSNFLSFLNPNDIESFTVLKDASATAIYGSRASNGVIIVTTKKGAANQSLKISYDGSTSVASAIKYVSVFDSTQIKQLGRQYAGIYGPESLKKFGTANTDWQSEIFRVSTSQDHNLSLTGAYKFLPYRVSLGYTDQNGIMKNTDFQRLVGSVSLNPSFLNDALKLTINGKIMNTQNNFGDAGALGSAVAMDPTQVVKDGNAASAGYFQWGNHGASLGTPNPVEQLLDVDNKSSVNRAIGNIQFDYDLPVITGLHATLNMATDYTHSTGHNNRPTTAPSTLTSSSNFGLLDNYYNKNYNNLLDFYLNYKKDVPVIHSSFDLTGGYSWQHFERKGDNYQRSDTDATHKLIVIDSSRYITESFLVSFFGRLNYTLLDRYLLTVTVRDDGSSHFAKGHQWGLFPSVALAWKINEESFLKGINTLSDLKLRLGWGITGQQAVTGSDYPAQAVYDRSLSGSGFFYPFGGTYIPVLRPNAYDPDLKWEQTTTKNIGLDFGFFQNRINGSVDIYNRVTKDLIENVNIPSGINFSNTLTTNVGSLENNGYEITLNLIPVSQKDMSLNVGFNFTYNKNKITKLLLIDDPNYIGILSGGDSFTGTLEDTRVGYAAHSFFMNKQVYDSNGKPIEGLYVDLSGKGGTINGNNADKYIDHNYAPDYLIGFSLRYNYKNFDISTSTRTSLGNYNYNQVAAGASFDQMYQIGYWRNQSTYLNDTKFVKRQFTSDYFVQNASFFKMDNISAGYQFKNIVNKLGARVSFTVQNVFTITKYKGIDPEVDLGSFGIDNNFYPRPRTYTLGLNLTF